MSRRGTASSRPAGRIGRPALATLLAAAVVMLAAVAGPAAGSGNRGVQPRAVGPALTSTPLFAYFYQWF
ncbi:MAG TPA: hypothetical protein VFU36_15230, partial [Jatrophihabitans sp.]|nr:hypothetical protein [Jatrophihabitans sp.]